MKRTVAGACLLAAFGGGLAQNMDGLYQVGETKDSKWYLKTDRTKTIAARHYQVWIYVINDKSVPIFKGKPTPVYDYSLNEWRISCKDSTFIMGRTIYYTKDGTNVHDDPPELAYRGVTPDSVGEHVVQQSCNFLGDKAE